MTDDFLLKKFRKAIQDAFDEEIEQIAEEYAQKVKAAVKKKAAQYAVNLTNWMSLESFRNELHIVIREKE